MSDHWEDHRSYPAPATDPAPRPASRYHVFGEWLCQDVGECTCGGVDQYGHECHEANCGLEPLVRVEDALAAAAQPPPSVPAGADVAAVLAKYWCFSLDRDYVRSADADLAELLDDLVGSQRLAVTGARAAGSPPSVLPAAPSSVATPGGPCSECGAGQNESCRPGCEWAEELARMHRDSVARQSRPLRPGAASVAAPPTPTSRSAATEEKVRPSTARRRLTVMAGYLCEPDDSGCNGMGCDIAGMHHPECGWVPMADLRDVHAALEEAAPPAPSAHGVAELLAECAAVDNRHASKPYNAFENGRISTFKVRRLLGLEPAKWNEDGTALAPGGADGENPDA